MAKLVPPVVALTLLIGGMTAPGCTPEKRQITPTTSGTDLRNIPRGRMTPQPFPGSSLAQTPKTTTGPHSRFGPPTDSATITAAASNEGAVR